MMLLIEINDERFKKLKDSNQSQDVNLKKIPKNFRASIIDKKTFERSMTDVTYSLDFCL